MLLLSPIQKNTRLYALDVQNSSIGGHRGAFMPEEARQT